ncbi:MAG TPA: DUF4242 domain-containing protein [Gemmatimonadaceae bacterium]|nr:DUF4242 domain-containing protein [Gemmatimonadaceae bacterium]
MPKFLIERAIPGAGAMSAEDLRSVAAKSNAVLKEMNTSGKDVHWVQSYVTPDKLYCVYTAPDEATVREHAKRGGFPANTIVRVKETIDPATAD